MRYRGGHLGVAVSALLDGQLGPSSAERAWAHVHTCDSCRRQVRREGWVKTRLATMTGEDGGTPPEQLLGSLYGLGMPRCGPPDQSGAAAWAAVEEIERRGRARRTGLALAGAGSVSVAVLGLASLTGASLGIGGSSPAPTTALTRAPVTGTPAVVAPVARVHGRLPRAATPSRAGAAQSRGEARGGLPR
jgi:predicted anti-sigma-YlaC factor YlaD